MAVGAISNRKAFMNTMGNCWTLIIREFLPRRLSWGFPYSKVKFLFWKSSGNDILVCALCWLFLCSSDQDLRWTSFQGGSIYFDSWLQMILSFMADRAWRGTGLEGEEPVSLCRERGFWNWAGVPVSLLFFLGPYSTEWSCGRSGQALPQLFSSEREDSSESMSQEESFLLVSYALGYFDQSYSAVTNTGRMLKYWLPGFSGNHTYHLSC